MNCYLCQVETGNAFHPALAICQRCGAGICGEHLVESVVTPVIGLAGDSRSILICCRCSAFSPRQARLPESRKQVKGRDGQGRASGWSWLRWLRRRRLSTLPNPEEAVAAVERFLHRQRSE